MSVLDMGDRKGIVLNRMYTGSYLSTNLGHEVVNMFQADNGNHYLYLSAKGNFAAEHKGQISDMLLVRYVGDNKVEVLAWANGLKEVPGADESYKDFEQNGEIFQKQRKYIEDNGITYGKRDLIAIFGGSDQQNVYITYLAENFYRPRKRIFLHYVDEGDLLYADSESRIENGENDLTIFLTGYQFGKATLKQYIYPNDHKNGIYKFDGRKKAGGYVDVDSLNKRVNGKRASDWGILNTVLNPADDTIWDKVQKGESRIADTLIDEHQPKQVSLFDIMPKLQRDENCFSDAIEYFMNRDRREWEDVLCRLCGNVDIGNICSVVREKDATVKKANHDEVDVRSDQGKGGRIDLLIETENAYIVIENKIKSGINRKKGDQGGQNQLDRYRRYVDFLNADKGKQCFYFVLAPDYNMPDSSELKGYAPLHYSTLVGRDNGKEGILKEYNEIHKDENLWSAFYLAMKRHSYESENDSLYEDMKCTFFTRIKELPQRDRMG